MIQCALELADKRPQGGVIFAEQMQDFLGLGSGARMNLPGTKEGNWEWRLSALPPADVRERLRQATRIYGRSAR